jgi:hypothetical protein
MEVADAEKSVRFEQMDLSKSCSRMNLCWSVASHDPVILAKKYESRGDELQQLKDQLQGMEDEKTAATKKVELFG